MVDDIKITLLSEEYLVLDAKEKVTVADSFVLRQNKIGSGNGEAKLYLGNESESIRTLFGNKGFRISCFLLKSDLEKYLVETEPEYLHPEQNYNDSSRLPGLYEERKIKIANLPEKITFEVEEQDQVLGPRIYVNSKDVAYGLIRELSLPNITYISIAKLKKSGGGIEYYFKLFADYFGEDTHPFILQQEEKVSEAGSEESQARKGQGKYRRELLDECPFCPITMVSDERVLIASHIKPWAQANDHEKIDPKNGFMFTPTFDWLFDKGFMSFSDEKKVILSPFLSKVTYSKLGISPNKIITALPIEGREDYLDYHRREILK